MVLPTKLFNLGLAAAVAAEIVAPARDIELDYPTGYCPTCGYAVTTNLHKRICLHDIPASPDVR